MNNFLIDFFINKSNHRKVRLLKELSTEPKDIETFADKLAVSKETIRKDFSYFADVQPDAIIKTTELNKVFYTCSPQNKYQLMLKIIQEEPSFFIFKHLFSHDKLDVTKILTTFFFSESTYARYLKALNHLLFSYSVKLKNNPLILTGSELNIRNFYNKLLYFSREYPIFVNDLFFYDDFIASLKEQFPSYIASYDTNKILYRFKVSVKRLSLGHTIHLSDKQREGIVRCDDYELFKKQIARLTKQYFQLHDLPEDEFVFFTVMLKEGHVYCKDSLHFQLQRQKHYLFNKTHKALCRQFLNIQDETLLDVLSCYLNDVYILNDFAQTSIIDDLLSYNQPIFYEEKLYKQCLALTQVYTDSAQKRPVIAYTLCQIIMANQIEPIEQITIYLFLDEEKNRKLYIEAMLINLFSSNINIVSLSNCDPAFQSNLTTFQYLITNHYAFQENAHTYYIGTPCEISEIENIIHGILKSFVLVYE
ncbi:helix-turn-helix domain-containing protein [Listeria kieliensis]